MKKRLGPREQLYPMPAVFVVGGTMEGADAMAVAWIAIAGATPPSVMMAVRRTRRTLELIEATGTFTVNTPRATQARELDFVGIVSGRGGRDKIAEAGLTLAPSVHIPTPIIAECPHNIECRVSRMIEAGEYVIVIGEILEVHADEDILDETGERPSMERLDPLVYICGVREYRRLGEKVADAYTIGKAIGS